MKIILFAIYILLILTVIFVERKSPTEALLWVLVMVCLPYVGAILYLIFGSTISIKITAWSRKKRLQECSISAAHAAAEIPDSLRFSEEDRQVIHFNSTYNKSELTCFEAMNIYTDGASHYKQLIKDISDAKECIYFEFYTIHNDEVGRYFVNALTEKAEEGIKVLVMCDFIANISTPPEMFRPLREAGGTVLRLKPYLTHYRSHRKIVVIDHETAYIGGMNIGKQYANMAEKKNPWRDTQVRITGPCVSVLDKYFLTDWLCAIPRKKWTETLEYVQSIPQSRKSISLSSNLCQFIAGGVDTNRESVKMCYMSMIRSAKSEIRIQTPYFIPDSSVLDALKAAAASGVKIKLMIPGIKASFFLDPVTTYYCGQLMEYGAEVYKYNGYIHAKTMVIDNELCCIGSVNMDMRSLMLDDEVCGVFYENSMAEKYLDIYEHDIENCRLFSFGEFQSRSTGERLMESFFLLFAPLM